MIINSIIGFLLGAAAKPLSDVFSDKLLKARGKSLSISRFGIIAQTLISAFLGAGIGLILGTGIRALFLLLLLFIGNIVSTCDISCRTIPNETVLAMLVLKLIFGALALLRVCSIPSWQPLLSLAGFAVMAVIFFLPALKGGKVGAGDVKLAMAVGFASELMPGLLAVVFMGILVLAYGFVQKRLPSLGSMSAASFLKSSFPMGPFLCAAQITSMLLYSSGAVILK